jgi:hypothetical protein
MEHPSRTCFQDLHTDILPLVMQHLRCRDNASVSCVTKELRRVVEECTELNQTPVSKFMKLQAIFNDMFLKPAPPVTLAFHNRQGYVLFSIIHDGTKVYYKLDGMNNSPRFNLTCDSVDLFYKFVMREINDVRGFDMYVRGTPSSFLYTLQKRLQSALL